MFQNVVKGSRASMNATKCSKLLFFAPEDPKIKNPNVHFPQNTHQLLRNYSEISLFICFLLLTHLPDQSVLHVFSKESIAHKVNVFIEKCYNFWSECFSFFAKQHRGIGNVRFFNDDFRRIKIITVSETLENNFKLSGGF